MSTQDSSILRKGITLCLVTLFLIPVVYISNVPSKNDTIFDESSIIPKKDLKSSQIIYPYNGSELSNITLELVLHDVDHIVEGVMKIDYFNNDLMTFDALAFHTFVDGMYYDVRAGSMEIFHVYENGNPGTPLPFQTHPDDQYMWVNLSSPLNPKSRVQFDIHFNTTFPDGGIDRCNEHAIIGDDSSRIFKYAWGYPIPVVFDEYDGWNLDPYKIDGEPFYADMAWYNVTVNVLDDFVVAATGLNYQTDDLGTRKKYYYDPELPVREFTFSASKYFLITTTDYNGTTILRNYYLPGSASNWGEPIRQATLSSFYLGSLLVGPYPYPTMNVVEEFTHYGGMEHACQVYISAVAQNFSSPQHFLENVISHEVSHQWFFHLIGNDQADAGFIDEGFACWLDGHYHENYHYFDWGPAFVSEFENVRRYEDITGYDHRINCSVYDFASYNSSYWNVAYTKTQVILQKLRRTIGTGDFYDGMRLMYQRFAFKFIWLDGVQKAFEDSEGRDLDWFFQPWFNNQKLPEYNIVEASFNQDTDELTLDIEDIRDATHLYSYSQQIPVEIFTKTGESVHNETVWVTGANNPDAVMILHKDAVPHMVKIYNRDEVLAYKLDGDGDVIDEYLVTINRRIPGFSILLVFLSMFSIVIVLTRIIKKEMNKK